MIIHVEPVPLSSSPHRTVDGKTCLLTHTQFKPFVAKGIQPALAHIIPISIHGKVCIELSHLLPIPS